MTSCNNSSGPVTTSQITETNNNEIELDNIPIYIVGPVNKTGSVLIADNRSLYWVTFEGTTAKIQSSLDLPGINDLAIDTENNTWAATDSGIAIINSQGVITNYFRNEPLNNDIKAIHIDQNRILISVFGKGILSADISHKGNDIELLNFQNVLDVLSIHIEGHDSSVLIATIGGGLIELTPMDKIIEKNSIGPSKIKYVNNLYIQNDKIWIATYSGIFGYSDGKWHQYEIPDKPKSEFMYTVQPIDENMILAGGAGGLFAYCEQLDEWKEITTSPDDIVYDIFKKDDLILIASFNGLIVFTNGDLKSICQSR
jgi:ligand-binding sensor domain-containing protein